MPLQVVHPQHWFIQRSPQGAGQTRTHQQRTGQAGAPGVRHHVHVGQPTARLGQYRLGQRQHTPDMVAAGQLGHHTTIGLVHLDLAV